MIYTKIVFLYMNYCIAFKIWYENMHFHNLLGALKWEEFSFCTSLRFLDSGSFVIIQTSQKTLIMKFVKYALG